MKNYYFLATMLPPLQMGTPPEIPFEEFDYLLRLNLSVSDYAQTTVIRRFYDLQNIKAFWKDEPLDPHGNFDVVELEEALIAREGFPDYVYSFLDKHDSKEERVRFFPGLIAAYFREEIARATGFLREYLKFEREWRLVLIGFRAKQLDRDLAAELQFEDFQDDLVAQILAQKDAPRYLPPEGYETLEALFQEYGKLPKELYLALDAYRFAKIESLLKLQLFSIGRILGYLVQLIAVEQWQFLNLYSQQSPLEQQDGSEKFLNGKRTG